MGRALRVMFCANDGFSVGHVTRTLAIARALRREANARSIDSQALLATTSEAHSLLTESSADVAVVRLPPPARARDAGFSDTDRRRLVRGTIEGAANAFAPDLIVVDTFPSGPHGELAGLVAATGAKLALVRRHVPADKEKDETIAAGLERYHRVIVAEDFVEPTVSHKSVHVAHVGPITSVEPSELMDRDAARAALGLPRDQRAVLVLAGGGGDHEAVNRARKIAEEIPKIDPSIRVVLGVGPLADPKAMLSAAMFKAFDGAIAPAGYNTAMELTMAGVPTAFYAQARPFDDQLGRVREIERRGGLAIELATQSERNEVERALVWMKSPAATSPRTSPRVHLKWGGAGETAKELLALVGAAAAPKGSL